MQSGIDLNRTLNYHIVMIKGRSARKCFKPGGPFLKQLLKNSYTLAKAPEPSQLLQTKQPLSVLNASHCKCASSNAVTYKYCLLTFSTGIVCFITYCKGF